MTNKPITLPILHHTDETTSLKALGIDYKLEETEVKTMNFYNINAIAAYVEDEKEYTSIFTNGTEWLCTLPHNEVVKIIENAL